MAAGHAWDASTLSLRLIEARNRTLAWLAAFDADTPARREARRLAARAGWWMEHWIVRNVQAQRGEACDPALPRLASIDPALVMAVETGAEPPAEGLRAYLAETLEAVLELLTGAGDDDAAIYFYRLAWLHEDRIAERLAELAEAADLAGAPWSPTPARAERPPLWLPAQRFMLGAEPGGLVPANQRWAHEVAVPESEIDAQVVNWARFAEFAEDGGYDDPRWWSEAGWAWVQAEERRAPRGVEQIRLGVTHRHAGRLQRAGATQPAIHVSRHEAEAWCAWAGRRLPTEVEWELAACTAASRGFVWGDVLEWVAGRPRGWPGYAPLPGDLDPLPEQDGAVLRGGCWLGDARLHHPKARRFAVPEADRAFCGFRSCAR
jgi:formylglycine-generating enzyme required for sulfatase activity